MSDDFYMKAPCKHCPFRNDVTPFLHPERAEEIAYAAQNRYSEFHCHKTLDYDAVDDESDEAAETENTKLCAGFLALQINEGAVEQPKGFTMPDNAYSDAYEMIEAYDWEWNKKQRKKRA
jgi:hypothetical protein